MGGIIKAICECGFKTDFIAGSTSTNYNEVCNAPALCLNCRNFLVKNYLSDYKICPVCNNSITFYNDPCLQKKNKSNNSYINNFIKTDFILPDTECLCPECSNTKMRFVRISCCE